MEEVADLILSGLPTYSKWNYKIISIIEAAALWVTKDWYLSGDLVTLKSHSLCNRTMPKERGISIRVDHL